MRLWGGRFSEENDERVADFTRSIEIDRELAADDLRVDRPRPRPGARRPADRRRGRRADRGPRGAGRGGRRRHDRPGTRRSRTSTSISRSALGERIGSVAGQAPYRALAQRPGRDGPAALAAPRDRPTGRRRSSSSSGRSSTLAERDGTAVLPGHDPHPARPAGAVRPSPAGLRRDGRARPWPPRRRAPAGQRLARSGRARWPVPGIRSTARRPRTSSASTASPRNSLDAVSDRDFVVEVAGGGGARRWSIFAAGRGGHLVVEPAIRVRPRR